MKINAIILAAGQGTRMRSKRAKVLHTIGGVPMLAHVVKATAGMDVDKLMVVYGHDGAQVQSVFTDNAIHWIHQEKQLGTGHAVQQAMAAVEDDVMVMVLYGDTPLIQAETLKDLLGQAGAGLAILTTVLDVPEGYGRIIRDGSGVVEAIIEQKDATEEQLSITEVNTGILAVNAGHLRGWLARLENNNAQGEFYLTDVIAMAVGDGIAVTACICADSTEVMGINNRQQQAAVERSYQRRQTEQQMVAGVTLTQPDSVTINGDLHCGADVIIAQSVVFNGRVTIGDGVTVGPFCVISDSQIGDDVMIQSHSVIDQATIGDGCRIGPYARLRPEACLGEQVHVGNFVEIKKSTVAAKSKINHLSYIGDASIGSGVNIGAGTITCNYDGANKFQTIIKDNVFIGSASQLVAPVTIGAGATVAAGSTITRNVAEGVLVISRVKQKTVTDWIRPIKKES